MLYAKVSTDKTVTFGPVLAADGTMSSGALAYTDAKIFKNGTDGALNASATFTHKYEGCYALLLKAADLDAVGCYEVVLNKNPLSASPVKITVLAANVYDWLFGTTAPSTLTQTQVSGGAYDLTNATYTAALKTALGTVPASLAVGAIANDAITAAAIATGALTADAFAANAITNAAVADDVDVNLKTSTAGVIAAAVWSADATSYQTQGTFGQAIGDPAADANTIYKAVLTRLPDATAGEAGGLLIAGSNVATTFAALTVTNAMTFSGAVVLTDQTTALSLGKYLFDILADTVVLPATWVVPGVGTSTLTTGDIDARLAAIHLDHLFSTAASIPSAAAGTFYDQLLTNGSATYDRTTDSLQAIRDRGDAAWITATGFSTHNAAAVVTALGTGSTLTALATAAALTTLDTLVDRMAPLLVGNVTGAGTGREVYSYGGVTATVTVTSAGNVSSVVFS